jgi:uncharacterized Zn finger protein (UPF0148 family)
MNESDLVEELRRILMTLDALLAVGRKIAAGDRVLAAEPARYQKMREQLYAMQDERDAAKAECAALEDDIDRTGKEALADRIERNSAIRERDDLAQQLSRVKAECDEWRNEFGVMRDERDELRKRLAQHERPCPDCGAVMTRSFRDEWPGEWFCPNCGSVEARLERKRQVDGDDPCPDCGRPLTPVRPGKVQCNYCDFVEARIREGRSREEAEKLYEQIIDDGNGEDVDESKRQSQRETQGGWGPSLCPMCGTPTLKTSHQVYCPKCNVGTSDTLREARESGTVPAEEK